MRLYVSDHNNVIPDLSKRYNLIDKQEYEFADAVIMWNEVVGENEIIARRCLKLGIPFYVVQHGLLTGDTEYRHCKSQPFCRKIFAWSDYSKQLYIDDGAEEDQVVVTGAPMLKHWVKPQPDGKTVVYVPPHSIGNTDYYMTAEHISKAWPDLLSMKDIHPVAKISKGFKFLEGYGGELCYTDRDASDHIPQIFDLLKTASCVVTHHESTFEFLAMSMDIPIIKIKNLNPIYTNALKEVDISEIKKSVEMALTKPECRRLERKVWFDRFAGPWKDVKADEVMYYTIGETKLAVA